MGRKSFWESTWGVVVLIAVAQIALPLVALATCHPRESESETLMWQIMSDRQHTEFREQWDARQDAAAEAEADRETPHPLDR